MFEKIKNLAVKTVKKIENALAPMMATAVAMGITSEVYAKPAGTSKPYGPGAIPETESSASEPAYTTAEAVGDIMDIIYKIFKYVGIVLTLWGAGSLILAFKNEDAESKTRAIMSLVVGICLVSVKSLFGDIIDELLQGI